MPLPAWLWTWSDWTSGNEETIQKREDLAGCSLWWRCTSHWETRGICLLTIAEWGDQLANLGRGVSVGEQSLNAVIRRRELGLVPFSAHCQQEYQDQGKPCHSHGSETSGGFDMAMLMTTVHIHTGYTPSPQTVIHEHKISLLSFRLFSQKWIEVFSVNVLQFVN